MKLGPVTKSDKSNKTTSKKFYDDVMSANCDAYLQVGDMQKIGSIVWR